MPVKQAPEPGTVVKETKFTESIPSVRSADAADKMEFWDYIESLKPADWPAHLCYVYRWRASDNMHSAAGKLSLPFDEMTIKDTFGGGIFRLLLKRNGQIYKRLERFVAEGAPKDPDEAPASASNIAGNLPANGEMGLLAQILHQQNQLFKELLERSNTRPAVDDAMRGALELQRDGFRSVVSEVRAIQPNAAPAPNPMDDLMRQFMTAAITKMMNPADPIEAFSKMATAFTSLNLGNAAGGTHAPSIGVEIVRAIGPSIGQIAQAVTAGYQAQMRSSMPPVAANGRTIDVTAQQPPPLRANADDNRGNVTPMPGPAAPQPAALPAAANQDAAAPATGADEMPKPQAPNIEWVEAQLINLMNDLNLTPEEAAQRGFTMLEDVAPNVLADLNSDMALRWVFANRPMFATYLKIDEARKTAIITEFMRCRNTPPEQRPAESASAGDGLLLTPEPPPAS